MPPYVQVFFEALAANQLLPLTSEAMLAAMQAFGGFDLRQAAALGALGAVLAHAVNYALGRGLLELKRREQVFVSEKFYAAGARLGRRWALPLLLFTWVPFGALLPVAAGFFHVPPLRAALVVALGEVGFYGYMLLY